MIERGLVFKCPAFGNNVHSRFAAIRTTLVPMWMGFVVAAPAPWIGRGHAPRQWGNKQPHTNTFLCVIVFNVTAAIAVLLSSETPSTGRQLLTTGALIIGLTHFCKIYRGQTWRDHSADLSLHYDHAKFELSLRKAINRIAQVKHMLTITLEGDGDSDVKDTDFGTEGSGFEPDHERIDK
ncbi:hypothetical protein EVAR_38619_1 [Eumeta japonica]|uniref:Uncharacterized protein n=1 Tax=Eumeta variegata TaxID=151549 RepID=A0A4C1WU33_EUMVA|nr:hypothetical protein EVAR_38619_1 [Eumeta japonica]